METISDGHWADSNVDFFFYKETILTKRKSQYIFLIFAQNLRCLYFLYFFVYTFILRCFYFTNFTWSIL